VTRSQIRTFALEKALNGRLFDLNKESQRDRFLGSCDRFAEIAHAFQGRQRVLDVGTEGGILLSLLTELGHECHAVDITDDPAEFPEVYQAKKITFHFCNVEVDLLPYPDSFFDAVSCCQCLEHFTHSHLPAMREFHRVLKPGGLLEVDVPNVASLRNRWRLARGKNITYDFEEHYVDAKPVQYKGMHFYPMRHNREFTKEELELLFRRAGFGNVKARFLRSRRVRFGAARLKSLGSWLRGAIPSLRKSLICFGTK
jgi:SAM-dependent methyltransferase